MKHLKHRKIRSSWRTLVLPLQLVCFFINYSTLSAQVCPGTGGSVTYDTVFVSNGGGGTWNVVFQELPFSETVYAFVIRSSFSIGGTGLFFSNASGIAIANPQATIGHTATWSIGSLNRAQTLSPVLEPATGLPITVTAPPLNVGSGTMVAFNHASYIPAVNDSVTTADADLTMFSGVSTGFFEYFTNASGTGNVSGLNIIPFTTTDEHVTLTIYYCDNVVLTSDLSAFSAERADDHSVLLSWSISEEQEGKKYEAEVSPDGVTFSSVATLSGKAAGHPANYTDLYTATSPVTGKLWFRVKESTHNISDRYSPVKEVEMTSRPLTASVYPNPAVDYVDLILPGPADQVDIYNAEGVKLQSVGGAPASHIALSLSKLLKPGIYFIRATGKAGYRTYTASFFLKEK